jgi:hypothetical protein
VLYDFPGIVVNGAGTIVAAESFEGPSVTHYDLRANVTTTGGSVTLWLRANAEPAATDLGCRLAGNAGGTQLVMFGSTAMPQQAASALQQQISLRATVVRDAPAGVPNVRCTARLSSGATLTTTGSVALPAGTVGLAAAAADVIFEGLITYERDDNPLQP